MAERLRDRAARLLGPDPAKRIRKVRDGLRVQNEPDLTWEDVGGAFLEGMSPQTARGAVQRFDQSLVLPIGPMIDSEHIPSKPAQVSPFFQEIYSKASEKGILESLTNEERIIVTARCHPDLTALSLEYLGALWGFSRERIRKIEERAFTELIQLTRVVDIFGKDYIQRVTDLVKQGKSASEIAQIYDCSKSVVTHIIAQSKIETAGEQRIIFESDKSDTGFGREQFPKYRIEQTGYRFEIDVLGLSNRTRNALLRSIGIEKLPRSLQELDAMPDEDIIQAAKQFGDLGLIEFRLKMLELRNNLFESQGLSGRVISLKPQDQSRGYSVDSLRLYSTRFKKQYHFMCFALRLAIENGKLPDSLEEMIALPNEQIVKSVYPFNFGEECLQILRSALNNS